MENIQILHRPEQSPLIKAWAVAKIMNFQFFVGFIYLRDFNIIQLCIFFLWIRFFNRGICWGIVAKQLWFFISLRPVCHVENLQCWGWSLCAVSGCSYLEPGKTNVCFMGKEFDMNPWTLLGYNYDKSVLFWITVNWVNFLTIVTANREAVTSAK